MQENFLRSDALAYVKQHQVNETLTFLADRLISERPSSPLKAIIRLCETRGGEVMFVKGLKVETRYGRWLEKKNLAVINCEVNRREHRVEVELEGEVPQPEELGSACLRHFSARNVANLGEFRESASRFLEEMPGFRPAFFDLHTHLSTLDSAAVVSTPRVALEVFASRGGRLVLFGPGASELLALAARIGGEVQAVKGKLDGPLDLLRGWGELSKKLGVSGASVFLDLRNDKLLGADERYTVDPKKSQSAEELEETLFKVLSRGGVEVVGSPFAVGHRLVWQKLHRRLREKLPGLRWVAPPGSSSEALTLLKKIEAPPKPDKPSRAREDKAPQVQAPSEELPLAFSDFDADYFIDVEEWAEQGDENDFFSLGTGKSFEQILRIFQLQRHRGTLVVPIDMAGPLLAPLYPEVLRPTPDKEAA